MLLRSELWCLGLSTGSGNCSTCGCHQNSSASWDAFQGKSTVAFIGDGLFGANRSAVRGCDVSWAVSVGRGWGCSWLCFWGWVGSHQGWVAPLPLSSQLPGVMFLSDDGALRLDVPPSCSSSGTEQRSARLRHFHLSGVLLFHPQAPAVPPPALHPSHK